MDRTRDSESPGELYIDGLLMESAVTVLGGTKATPGGNLGRLSLSHSTLAPGGGLTVAAGDPGVAMTDLRQFVSQYLRSDLIESERDSRSLR